MILLDTDVLVVDLRYPNDAKFPINRRALDRFRDDGIPAGVTAQTLLETIGILSFNLSPQRIPLLAHHICSQYRLSVFPDPQSHAGYAGCTVDDLVAQMSTRMALGDAVQAVQIQIHASGAQCLLTWNAKHFSGKLSIPAMTPEEWLNAAGATAP